MEEAAELADYLPLSFKTESEQEYIQFLWEAFESNYENKKNQFALQRAALNVRFKGARPTGKGCKLPMCGVSR